MKRILAGVLVFAWTGSVYAVDHKTWDITDPAHQAEIINDLQGGLENTRRGTVIGRCVKIIEYVEFRRSGKDTSFGAVCTADDNGRSVVLTLCTDRMIGYFAVVEQRLEGEQLIRFIAENCPNAG